MLGKDRDHYVWDVEHNLKSESQTAPVLSLILVCSA